MKHLAQVIIFCFSSIHAMQERLSTFSYDTPIAYDRFSESELDRMPNRFRLLDGLPNLKRFRVREFYTYLRNTKKDIVRVIRYHDLLFEHALPLRKLLVLQSFAFECADEYGIEQFHSLLSNLKKTDLSCASLCDLLLAHVFSYGYPSDAMRCFVQAINGKDLYISAFATVSLAEFYVKHRCFLRARLYYEEFLAKIQSIDSEDLLVICYKDQAVQFLMQ